MGTDHGVRSEEPMGGEGSDTLDLAHEELRATFQYQVERLREIDSKAIEILKANLLLIGIVVTGGSVLTQTDLEVGLFINSFTVAGGVLLLVSTGLASVTYTSSNLRGGIGTAADEIELAIAEERARNGIDGVGNADVDAGGPGGSNGSDGSGAPSTDTTFEERLLRSYAGWIDYNARMTAVNDMLVTVTVLSVFVAFVYVVVGVVIAALRVPPLASWVIFIGLSALSLGFLWLTYHMDHLGVAEERPDRTFPGVRLSKGTTRRRGLMTLREMLGRSPAPEDLESETAVFREDDDDGRHDG
ncbi:hypothetical protein [Halorubrum vacuolatum]|uniref:Uncharacterized protein n=1 Tax=Halorubrum vacuolatum TaxID=63740 RepID=A0A238V8F8_HALVU|nr:hypothetical protein [Halorubrum vacuolatum]SNR29923.1 hypothetical protein SAMN06264855_1021 [Halorubrum vacuolatum]